MKLLKFFEAVSGLKINLNKSRLYGLGFVSIELKNMADWLKCRVGDI